MDKSGVPCSPLVRRLHVACRRHTLVWLITGITVFVTAALRVPMASQPTGTYQHLQVISYSLFGEDPRYIDGALANVRLYKKVFAGWTMRVYHDSTVPTPVLSELSLHGAQLFDMSRSHLSRMTWRFLPASDPSVKRMCSRDIDSRLSSREKAAVDAWISSGKLFHVMRDHPSHSAFAMSGGMWCSSQGAFVNMSLELEKLQQSDEYLHDMEFLNRVIWPVAQKSVLQHDSFSCRQFGAVPFPTVRVGMEHVGSVYMNGMMRAEDVDVLRRAINAGEEKKCLPTLRSRFRTQFK